MERGVILHLNHANFFFAMKARDVIMSSYDI